MSSTKILASITAAATTAIILAVPANAITGSDPYSSDGMWLVPSEVAPGTYRVTPTDSMGYTKLCADYVCEIGTNGFIDNELYYGPGVLVVPTNAVLVHLKDVKLTRMG